MKKIYSILLVAKLQLGRMTLWTGLAESGEEALTTATETANRIYGDLAWAPMLTNIMDIKIEIPTQSPLPVFDKDKNWILSTIIENKDIGLFSAMEKYLTLPEKKLINDKASFGLTYEDHA